jgi:hypothetical protein
MCTGLEGLLLADYCYLIGCKRSEAEITPKEKGRQRGASSEALLLWGAFEVNWDFCEVITTSRENTP